jgi:carboxypeptidase Taq
MDILKKIGLILTRGDRISASTLYHQFLQQDVRVNNQDDEHDFGNMTWSCIHEGGHALYEQGLSSEQYGFH